MIRKILHSVILSICDNGDKLPPYIISKGAKNRRINKKFLKTELVKNNKCYIICKCNSWFNKEIMKDWANNFSFIILKVK